MVYICAAAGIAAGGFWGRAQLMRWNICERCMLLWLAAGLLAAFLPGAFLMQAYGYHILKILRYWILLYGLLLFALIDSKEKRIPNRGLLVLTGVRTLLLAVEGVCFPSVGAELVISSLAGMLGGGFLFLAAGFLARRGLGMGDVKLIAVVGYYLGFRVLMSDMVISLLLTVAGGIVNLAVRKASLKAEMPFAPFVAAGTLVTILLGC